jgi:hypothetical protein
VSIFVVTRGYDHEGDDLVYASPVFDAAKLIADQEGEDVYGDVVAITQMDPRPVRCWARRRPETEYIVRIPVDTRLRAPAATGSISQKWIVEGSEEHVAWLKEP